MHGIACYTTKSRALIFQKGFATRMTALKDIMDLLIKHAINFNVTFAGNRFRVYINAKNVEKIEANPELEKKITEIMRNSFPYRKLSDYIKED